MESIILDTNVLSELMRPKPERAVTEWFAGLTGVAFYVTAITEAEILLGIALLPEGKRRTALAEAAETMFRVDFAGRCLPFDAHCAARYAAIVAGRRRAGFSITTEDAQIASIALNNGYALATRNIRDFLHIDGLGLLNPWEGGADPSLKE
jgi:predicted nucleic acid-binding protein